MSKYLDMIKNYNKPKDLINKAEKQINQEGGLEEYARNQYTSDYTGPPIGSYFSRGKQLFQFIKKAGSVYTLARINRNTNMPYNDPVVKNNLMTEDRSSLNAYYNYEKNLGIGKVYNFTPTNRALEISKDAEDKKSKIEEQSKLRKIQEEEYKKNQEALMKEQFRQREEQEKIRQRELARRQEANEQLELQQQRQIELQRQTEERKQKAEQERKIHELEIIKIKEEKERYENEQDKIRKQIQAEKDQQKIADLQKEEKKLLMSLNNTKDELNNSQNLIMSQNKRLELLQNQINSSTLNQERISNQISETKKRNEQQKKEKDDLLQKIKYEEDLLNKAKAAFEKSQQISSEKTTQLNDLTDQVKSLRTTINGLRIQIHSMEDEEKRRSEKELEEIELEKRRKLEEKSKLLQNVNIGDYLEHKSIEVKLFKVVDIISFNGEGTIFTLQDQFDMLGERLIVEYKDLKKDDWTKIDSSKLVFNEVKPLSYLIPTGKYSNGKLKREQKWNIFKSTLKRFDEINPNPNEILINLSNNPNNKLKVLNIKEQWSFGNEIPPPPIQGSENRVRITKENWKGTKNTVVTSADTFMMFLGSHDNILYFYEYKITGIIVQHAIKEEIFFKGIHFYASNEDKSLEKYKNLIKKAEKSRYSIKYKFNNEGHENRIREADNKINSLKYLMKYIKKTDYEKDLQTNNQTTLSQGGADLTLQLQEQRFKKLTQSGGEFTEENVDNLVNNIELKLSKMQNFDTKQINNQNLILSDKLKEAVDKLNEVNDIAETCSTNIQEINQVLSNK